MLKLVYHLKIHMNLSSKATHFLTLHADKALDPYTENRLEAVYFACAHKKSSILHISNVT